jgi:hypothetical protein
MAAALAALRALFVRMGVSQAAAIYFTNIEGGNSIQEIANLEDGDVERLCQVTHKPGGMMYNPNPGAAAPALVPHSGTPVSTRAEKNMKLLCYVARYHARVSRMIDIPGTNLDVVQTYQSFREHEKNHEDAAPSTINDRDWPRTLESFQNWLRGCNGQTDIPLAYVIRPTLEVPAEGDDPATNYSLKLDELIAHAPIIANVAANGTITYTSVYLQDRETVWTMIEKVTRDHACRTYIRAAASTRDGRMAYELLDQHYLGANNVDIMSSKAEHLLKTLSYNGETHHWDFEKFVHRHVEQHMVLASLIPHGYAGLDDHSKVRHLLDGIKTDKLDAVKNQVLSTPSLRKDFNAVVNLCQDVIHQKNMTRPGRDATVAALESGRDSITPDMSVEDRYYTRKEYNQLTRAQQVGLAKKHEAQGHKPGKRGRSGKGGQGGRNGNGGNGEVNLSKHSIKALKSMERAIKKVGLADNDESADASNDSDGEDKAQRSTRLPRIVTTQPSAGS